jgi:hypothetical protein
VQPLKELVEGLILRMGVQGRESRRNCGERESSYGQRAMEQIADRA